MATVRDARDEVLIAEAVGKPGVRGACSLRGGSWYSRYDGDRTGDPSSFDVDHLVPLNEAWQSGAWTWSSARRKAYANDLGYGPSLIAVSASSNRSKGDSEPQQWLPPRQILSCTYLSWWVAVKWRWRLEVDRVERALLRRSLSDCGWPRVRAPRRPVIRSSGNGSAGGGLDPRFSYCYEVLSAGLGPYRRSVDPEYAWYTDADNDGVVCET